MAKQNLIMKDHARHMRIRDNKQEVEEILKKMLTAFALFCALATAFAILTIPEAKAIIIEQKQESAYKHAISPELHSYIDNNRISRKQFIHEWDIERKGLTMEIFNEEEIYDTKISPLLRQIIDICNTHGIPMVASFTYENCPDRGTGRCTTLINNIENRVDDTLQKARNTIMNGSHEIFTVAIRNCA